MRVPRLLPAVHARGRRRRATSGRCPTATSRSPTSSSRPAQWDALQIPVSVAFFFVNSTTRSRRRVLPEPGGRDRVAAPARRVGRASSAPTPSWRRCSPTSRRSSSAPTAETSAAECFLVPDRRLLRAGRPAAAAVAGLRRRAARRTRPSTRSSTAYATGPGAMTGSDLGVRGARRARRAATPRCRRSCSALRITEHDRARPVHARRAAVPDPHRAAAAPLRARRGGAARRAVRRADRVGRLAAAVPVDPRGDDRHGVHGRRPRSTCRSRAPTTSRSRSTKYLHSLDDGEIPLVLLFSGHGVHSKRDGHRTSRRSRGTRRRRSGCRSRCGAR